MLTETLQLLFKRDLNKLRVEIESYKDEKKIWCVDKQIKNSAGNLCLHLVGNLNTYIGATLGNIHYSRNRELEFSLKDIPAAELVNKIEATMEVVNTVLNNLTDKQMDDEYPLLVFDNKTSCGYFLIHLTTHLAYHLGQINYHRRLLDI